MKPNATTEGQKQILIHALTGGKATVYRNHYFARKGDHNLKYLKKLKLVKRCYKQASGHMWVWMVTKKGARYVGLHLPE